MNERSLSRLSYEYSTFSFYDYGTDPKWCDYDLALSIGGVAGDFYIDIVKTNLKDSEGNTIYRVRLTLTDEPFNFEDWSKDGAHSDNPLIYAINQCGFFTQNHEMFVEFEWGFCVNFKYS